MYSPWLYDLLSNQSSHGNGIDRLSLRKLETLSRALLSVLLALLDPRIASHKTCMFEGWTKVGIKLEQRSRDAVPDRARLAQDHHQ